MKNSLIIVALLLLGLFTNAQNFIKLKDGDVTSKEITVAQSFANTYLTLNRGGMPYLFKDEAIDALKFQLTTETQMTVYNQIKNEFGDFESLSYSETWIDSSNSTFKVFRFKGIFSKSTKKLEIRVVLNSANKVSGFWLRPWSDMFN